MKRLDNLRATWTKIDQAADLVDEIRDCFDDSSPVGFRLQDVHVTLSEARRAVEREVGIEERRLIDQAALDRAPASPTLALP